MISYKVNAKACKSAKEKLVQSEMGVKFNPKYAIMALAVMTLLTSGCTNEAGYTNKTNVGTVTGVVLGGVAGSAFGAGSGRIAAIAAGAALGGLAGNAFGASLDRVDFAYRDRAFNSAMEHNRSGASSSWQNPDSGNRGAIIPSKTYVNHEGRNCREYTQIVRIGNKMEEAFGKACRRSDGSWEILS